MLIKIFLTFIFLLTPILSSAGLYLQHSISYNSHTDDAENFSYTQMHNLFYLGAAINNKQTFYLGQSIHISSKSNSTGEGATASTFAITEIGPRFIWFINERKTWQITFGYHPYAKGTRKIPTTGVEEEISGSSMTGSLNFIYPISKRFSIGAGFTYYSLSLKKSTTAAGSATTLTDAYSNIFGTFSIGFRF